MDPLYLSVTIVTLIGEVEACKRVFKRVLGLKGVPDLVYALHNETSDLQLILLDMHNREDFKDIEHVDRGLLNQYLGVLNETQEKMHQVAELLHRSILETGCEDKKDLRIDQTYLLRECDLINQLRVDLRNTKQRLQSICLDEDRRVSARIRAKLTIIEETSHSVKTQILDSESAQLPNRSPVVFMKAGSPAVYKIDYNKAPITPCSKCNCQRLRTSRVLRPLSGRVLMSCVSVPFRQDRGCGSEFRLVCWFPAWFLNYLILLRARHCCFAGLKFSFLVSPQLPNDHVIWDMVAYGDIEGMMRILSSSRISLQVQDYNGMKLLHVSSTATFRWLLSIHASMPSSIRTSNLPGSFSKLEQTPGQKRALYRMDRILMIFITILRSLS